MSAKGDVDRVQPESEANRDNSLPSDVKGQRRGRSVVQSVRLPGGDFAEIERLAGEAGVPMSAPDLRLGTRRTGR